MSSDCGADAVFWWEMVTKLTAGSPGNACPESIPAPWPHTYLRGSRTGSRGLWCKIPKLRHSGSSCLGLINHSGHVHQSVKLHLGCWGPAPGGPGAWARLPSADHPLGSVPTREPSGAVATLFFARSSPAWHAGGTAARAEPWPHALAWLYTHPRCRPQSPQPGLLGPILARGSWTKPRHAEGNNKLNR